MRTTSPSAVHRAFAFAADAGSDIQRINLADMLPNRLEQGTQLASQRNLHLIVQVD
jgi:hypothetical protein